MRVADARVAEARASIESAAAGSSAADVAASYATLTAPFDGVVTEKSVDPGNMASPGQPLITVEDDRDFRLEVRLDESRAAFVHVGDEVAGPTRRRRVGRAPAASPRCSGCWTPAPTTFSSRSMCRPARRCGPGCSAGPCSAARRARGSPCPQSAVVRRGQLASVFVVDADNHARLRLVNASEAADGRVEIRAGVQAGERVVVAPPPALVDGSPVTVGPAARGAADDTPVRHGRAARGRVHRFEADAAVPRRVARAGRASPWWRCRARKSRRSSCR